MWLGVQERRRGSCSGSQKTWVVIQKVIKKIGREDYSVDQYLATMKSK